MILPSISLNQLSRERLEALYFIALDLRELAERGSADHRYLTDLIAQIERHLLDLHRMIAPSPFRNPK